MRPLKLAFVWLSVGWLYAGLIVYLSLTSLPPSGPEFPQVDKLAHVLAYFLLMAWFMQLYEGDTPRWIHLGLFLLMGAGLEIGQGLGGVRQGEWFDMLANAAGVGLGFAVGRRFRLPLI